MYRKKHLAGIVLLLTITVTSCNKWKDHIAVQQQDNTINLLQAIAADPGLSTFRSYIAQAGLDSVLQASKTFTVWAPTNAAIQAIDPATVADKSLLRAFILNHISNQLYFTKDVTTTQRIAMLSGKYNNFNTVKFDEAPLNKTDKYVSNGVLHTINGIAPPLQSIWDFINSTTAQYAQNAYIRSLNYNAFDPSLAVIDSISILTGLPIYHPGTGLVARNLFNDRVYDTKREDKMFTYFVMQDANFNLEADSLKTYFTTTSTTATDSLTRWNVVKDLLYDAPYSTAFQVPQPLTSKSGITVPVNTAFVVDAKRMSNGYVYILSKLDVPTKNKFIPITIEGESPSGFLQYDKTAFINYRVRLNPVTSSNFSDILISGHGVTTFYSFYRNYEMPSMKYSVYAKATNDFQNGAFNETISCWNTELGTQQGTLTFAVPLFTATGAYDEKYLGDITNTRYGTLDFRATAVTTGPILLDYLRIVPVP
ncbi:MAG: fasciclin domain-containing protein [Bacteroidetes bacterium]|nr:fasciclin domain-containing protein [Bacteroidota bacterium]